MKKTKSERHHWWPECVSQRWADDQGGVHWLKPDGDVTRARPDNFGVIGNGHIIKLGNKPGETTPLDQNFENFFQDADDRFPTVIDWLEGLVYQDRIYEQARSRFIPQTSTDEMFGQMVESLVSLAIRSPLTREACVMAAECFRGPLPQWERNRLIAINMRDMHRRAVQAFGVNGKATAILSPHREFIFGDGFYHNLGSPQGAPSSPRILVPLTPRLAVLYAKPMRYSVEPRVTTLVVAAEEAEEINKTVQVYAREMLFYRTDKPDLIDDYRRAEHRQIRLATNVAEMILKDVPGVH